MNHLGIILSILCSSGEMLTDEEYQAYCSKMASTSAWGGQVELQAMATVLRRPIEVIFVLF